MAQTAAADRTAAAGSATDLKNVKEARPQTEDVLISLSSQKGGGAAA